MATSSPPVIAEIYLFCSPGTRLLAHYKKIMTHTPMPHTPHSRDDPADKLARVIRIAQRLKRERNAAWELLESLQADREPYEWSRNSERPPVTSAASPVDERVARAGIVDQT
jgi:hypothetical protein